MWQCVPIHLSFNHLCQCVTSGSSLQSKWPWKSTYWINWGHCSSHNRVVTDIHERGLPGPLQEGARRVGLMYLKWRGAPGGISDNAFFTVTIFKNINIHCVCCLDFIQTLSMHKIQENVRSMLSVEGLGKEIKRFRKRASTVYFSKEISDECVTK